MGNAFSNEFFKRDQIPLDIDENQSIDKQKENVSRKADGAIILIRHNVLLILIISIYYDISSNFIFSKAYRYGETVEFGVRLITFSV